MEQFERRCEEVGEDQRATCLQLKELSQQVVGTVFQSADECLRGLSGAVIGKLEGRLSQPVDTHEHCLQQAGAQLQEGSQGLARQIKRLEWLHRRPVCIGMAGPRRSVRRLGPVWQRGRVIRESCACALCGSSKRRFPLPPDGGRCEGSDLPPSGPIGFDLAPERRLRSGRLRGLCGPAGEGRASPPWLPLQPRLSDWRRPRNHSKPVHGGEGTFASCLPRSRLYRRPT